MNGLKKPVVYSVWLQELYQLGWLVRAVDPDGKSSAPDAQGIASSFFSPVFGTMPVILPALYMAGQMVYCLGIGVGLGIVPLAIAWILFARKG